MNQAARARLNGLEMNATCPAMSSFASHLICPLRIMWTAYGPETRVR